MNTFLNYLLSNLIQSSPISLGQIMSGVSKNQTLMLLVANLARYFLYLTRVMQVQV